MSKYILNKNKQDSLNGENYEIHNIYECTHLPDVSNRLDVGYCYDCKEAISKAKIKYPEYAKDVDGCFWCSNPCHTQ